MNEELIRKYQEIISLLQYRNPKCSFNGEFVMGDNGKIAFKLIYFNPNEENWGGYGSKTFKYMKTNEDALRYFIKSAQNRVF